MGFSSDGLDPVNVPAKYEVHSFTRSWDNRAYLKTLCSPWIRPRSLLSKIEHQGKDEALDMALDGKLNIQALHHCC